MTLLCGPAVKSSAESHGTEKWLLANEMDGKNGPIERND